MDRARLVNEWSKGKFKCFGCLVCGKESKVGNLAQRIREGLPKHCGLQMVLVRIDDTLADFKARNEEANREMMGGSK